jgi:hypothetical protein
MLSDRDASIRAWLPPYSSLLSARPRYAQVTT